MANLKSLTPLNRHLLVIPHFQEKKTQTGVLLPEDYESDKPRYIEATVVDIAPDCSPPVKKLKYNRSPSAMILIDSNMLEKLTVSDKDYYMILENYVMGSFKSPDNS